MTRFDKRNLLRISNNRSVNKNPVVPLTGETISLYIIDHLLYVVICRVSQPAEDTGAV